MALFEAFPASCARLFEFFSERLDEISARVREKGSGLFRAFHRAGAASRLGEVSRLLTGGVQTGNILTAGPRQIELQMI